MEAVEVAGFEVGAVGQRHPDGGGGEERIDLPFLEDGEQLLGHGSGDDDVVRADRQKRQQEDVHLR